MATEPATRLDLTDQPATIDDLLSDAHDSGFPATERLVRDWVGSGLLDHPDRRSLGRGKGTAKALWPAGQRNLFRLHIACRSHVTTTRPLCETVIQLWVFGPTEVGAELVPTRQAAKALATWAKKPASRGIARVQAKEVFDVFGEATISASLRHDLLDQVTEAIYDEALNGPKFVNEAHFLFETVEDRSAEVQILDRLVTPESYCRLLDIRIRGWKRARKATIEDLELAWIMYHHYHRGYEHARQCAVRTDERFAGRSLEGALATPTEHGRIRSVTRDLVILLGMISEEPASGVPRQRQTDVTSPTMTDKN